MRDRDTEHDHPEFRRFAWISFNSAVARAVALRRPIYRALREAFEGRARR